jgi:hypothetical protein
MPLFARGNKTMAICPVKRFTLELIRVYEGRIFKKLAWSTGENYAGNPHNNE